MSRIAASLSLFFVISLVLTGCTWQIDPAFIAEKEMKQSAIAQARELVAACVVPDVVGLNAEAAELMIIGTKLQPVRSTQFDGSVGFGLVSSQEPAGGSRLEPCVGEVAISISLGAEPAPQIPTPNPVPPTPVPPTPTQEPTATPVPPTPTPEPPTPTPTPDNVLFWDDFEKGLKDDWVSTVGDWRSINGELRPVKYEDGYAEITISRPEWTNFTVEFDFLGTYTDYAERDDGDIYNIDASTIPFFYVRTDPDVVNGYWSRPTLRDWKSNRAMCGYIVDEEYTAFVESHPLMRGDFHASIVADGDHIVFSIDDEEFCSFYDPEFASGGLAFGVSMLEDIEPVRFDNVVVSALP